MSSSDESPSPPQDLSASQLTIPSDSEAYSSLSPPSSSPPQSSDNNGVQPVVIYQPPTVWSILRGAAINLILPFVNGMMLGFGELLAHEFAFRLGWNSTNVSFNEDLDKIEHRLILHRFGHGIDHLALSAPASRCEKTQSKEDGGIVFSSLTLKMLLRWSRSTCNSSFTSKRL
jgi:hypothetical protein